MSEKISWILNVQVLGGPKISATDTIEVDAYDKFDITVLKTKTKSLAFVPGIDVTKIRLILIKPDKPDVLLTYKINNAGSSIKLDSTQALIGEGSVSFFVGALTSLDSLDFTNGSSADVSIQVLVGRIAT